MKNQAFHAASLVLLAGVLLGGSCRTPGDSTLQNLNNDDAVLALIDGDQIHLSEFASYMKSCFDDDLEDMNGISSRDLFDEYVTQLLITREAGGAGIQVFDEEIEQYLNDCSIRQDDFDIEKMKATIRDYLMVQKYLKQEVDLHLDITLQELINYYNANIEGFTVGDQAHVLEILTDARDQAEELKARINNGDSRKFREMARNFSRGATAEAEGDLGFFEKGDLPEEFDKVIFSLKPGEISNPFQSSHGYHLFYLEEWIPSHQYKFHEVRDEIFRRIAAQKERKQTEDYINTLKKQYSITIYESNFPVDIKEYGFDQNDK